MTRPDRPDCPDLLGRPGRPGPATAGAARPAAGRMVLILLVALTASNLAMGKVFAYLRVGPVYVGELALLVVGLGVLAGCRLRVAELPTPLVLLLAYTGVQVCVDVARGRETLEVLRDWSVVYYATFAILAFSATAGLLSGPAGGEPGRWRWLPGVACVAVLVDGALLAGKLAGLNTVTVLGAPVAVFKPTDGSVVAVVAVVLWLHRMLPTPVVALAAFPILLVCAAESRSVLVSLAVLALVFLRRRRARVAGALLIWVALVCAFAGLRVPTGYREISARQMVVNALSVVASPAAAPVDGLAANKSWRLDWWGAVLRDARNHRWVFDGAGWDVNLADRYGFQTASTVAGDHRLRHPHNAAVGILGRGGALPVALWAATYLTVLARLVRARRAVLAAGPDTVRTGPAGGCSRVLVDLALAAVCTGLVNGLTDVFLEAPQDAIPHWILIGAGLAAARQPARPARSRSGVGAQPDHGSGQGTLPDRGSGQGAQPGACADQPAQPAGHTGG